MTGAFIIIVVFTLFTGFAVVAVAHVLRRQRHAQAVDRFLAARSLDEVWGGSRRGGLDRKTCLTVMVLPAEAEWNTLALTEDGEEAGKISYGAGYEVVFNCKYLKRRTWLEKTTEVRSTGKRKGWDFRSDEGLITTFFLNGVDLEFALADGRFHYSALSGDVKRNEETCSVQIHPKGATELYYVVLHQSLSPSARAITCCLPQLMRKLCHTPDSY